jgi:1,2-diacylglycerol 3-beta-galactosyltransferase
MILRPAFHEPAAGDRSAERAAHGLPADGLVGAVMFGGHGSAEMLEVARALPDVPLILLCGHNERLARRLRALPANVHAKAPRVVVGFTAEVPRWLRLADFFVGKPGPGSLSEAVACGLPVVVTRNRRTMPQERYNTVWVEEQGVGVVIRRLAELPQAVQTVAARRAHFAAAVARQRNRAVLEVTELIAGLLAAPLAEVPPVPSLNCRATVTPAS